VVTVVGFLFIPFIGADLPAILFSKSEIKTPFLQ